MGECFNPCFTGSTTSTLVEVQNVTDTVLFQSLFYWKYHFNMGRLSVLHTYL